MDALALPNELKGVCRPALEEYVLGRIKQFSLVFAEQLLSPEAAGLPVEYVFNQSVCALDAYQQQEGEMFFLRFSHKCKFLGCRARDCTLCIDNPSKRCGKGDNFDESYADHQLLKSKCDADVHVELISTASGQPSNMAGVEVQICVVDGESCSSCEDGAVCIEGIRELHQSDEGRVLLGKAAPGGTHDAAGRILLSLQGGSCRLPDLHVAGKTDTFRLNGQAFASFRLMARAVQRDREGEVVLRDDIMPGLSAKFTVKSQRAMNDYNKPEFPHYKDKVTKLKYIGGVTAERLRDIQSHIADVPFSSIETVEQLKHLMLYTDQNRQIESKLLDVLHMMGRHKHKWDYLREILTEKVVYDDVMHRIWFANESQGVLFTSKQGQVNLEKPAGAVQRVMQGGELRLQVMTASDAQSMELMKGLRCRAEEAWAQPGHPGWVVVTEQLDMSPSSNGVSASLGQHRRPQVHGMADPLEGSQKQMPYIKQEGGGPPSSPPFSSLMHVPSSAASQVASDAQAMEQLALQAQRQAQGMGTQPLALSQHAGSSGRMAAANPFCLAQLTAAGGSAGGPASSGDVTGNGAARAETPSSDTSSTRDNLHGAGGRRGQLQGMDSEGIRAFQTLNPFASGEHALAMDVGSEPTNGWPAKPLDWRRSSVDGPPVALRNLSLDAVSAGGRGDAPSSPRVRTLSQAICNPYTSSGCSDAVLDLSNTIKRRRASLPAYAEAELMRNLHGQACPASAFASEAGYSFHKGLDGSQLQLPTGSMPARHMSLSPGAAAGNQMSLSQLEAAVQQQQQQCTEGAEKPRALGLSVAEMMALLPNDSLGSRPQSSCYLGGSLPGSNAHAAGMGAGAAGGNAGSPPMEVPAIHNTAPLPMLPAGDGGFRTRLDGGAFERSDSFGDILDAMFTTNPGYLDGLKNAYMS